MASVAKTKEYFLRLYPDQFESGGDVMAHMLLTQGDKHQWIKGELVPTEDVVFIVFGGEKTPTAESDEAACHRGGG